MMAAPPLSKSLKISVLVMCVLLASCSAPNKPQSTDKLVQPQPATEAMGIEVLGKNLAGKPGAHINDILQDTKGNYWFATNGEGVYRYDGKAWKQFTTLDGLPGGLVQAIQEDKGGGIWLNTGDFGVYRFDGKAFHVVPVQSGPLNTGNWPGQTTGLWFAGGGGVYRYDGKGLNYFPLPGAGADKHYTLTAPNSLSRYGVYCILKDSRGALWFGTQSMGVCRYDGHAFTWFTQKGLAGTAVRALFEDRDGDMWFGNNGSGLFKYDGKALRNITMEKGLANPEFLRTGRISAKAVPGTMGRVFAIAQDRKGELWIGTTDAGVWRYNGEKLTNYTLKDGLASNAINVIYKDKNGWLWLGTDGEGICKYNGTSFSNFPIE